MIMVLEGDDEKDLDKTVKNIHESMKCIPDKVIDCHGSQESLKLAIRSTARGGTCCLVGMASGDFTDFPLMDDLMREVKITSNFHHCNDYRAVLGIVPQGKYDLLKLITHHFTMENATCAFDKAYKQEPGTMKVIVHLVQRNTNNKNVKKK
uniref:Alcohol dehydrogenase-like C-terminal domain-containing protein n=1 Tax=Glossina pallidipes TaxID=7398 RepID=A0A1A9ZA96_GLOPL